jgi:formate/nitrite transporter FocA (FNT family)
VIVLLTYYIGLGHLSHVVAGSIQVFALAFLGEASWSESFGGFFLPALLGNVVGGLIFVTALNHAQVTAGEPAPRAGGASE